jgi:hypothetical protein
MKGKILISCLLVYGLLASGPTLAADKEASSAESSLKGTIDRIIGLEEDWVEGGFAPYMLFSHEEFIVIYNNPCKYMQEAKRLVREKSLSRREGIAIAFAMYRLPLGSYLDWMDYVRSVQSISDTRDKLLEYVSFPDLELKPELYLAYQRPEVVRYYEELLKTNTAIQNKDDAVKRVLSGEDAAWIRRYFGDNGKELPTVQPAETCTEQ